MPEARDARIRAAAFEFLRAHTFELDGLLSRELLLDGFLFEGQKVPLLDRQRGIHRPRILAGLPLSFMTAPERPGRPRPYDDQIEAGLVRYRYRGVDPAHPDNEGLRKAWRMRLNLIYFHGIIPGLYAPVWPVQIEGDDPKALTFTVSMGETLNLPDSALPSTESVDPAAPRAYAAVLAFRRLHQRTFREQVLRAYQSHCAICHLRHEELLDAAHILPDGHPRGEPIVPNGLALCKLHHAAFDRHFIGVRPDYVIEVRRRILEETDGPMLTHGLKEIHGKKIIAPSSPHKRPNPDFLDERFALFKKAS